VTGSDGLCEGNEFCVLIGWTVSALRVILDRSGYQAFAV